MEWLAVTGPTSPITAGASGKVYLLNKTYKQEIPVPAGCTITNRKPSFATWVRGTINRKYICGAPTENLVFSEGKRLRRLSISAPTGPLINTASPSGNQIGYQLISGGGLTGNIILYLRFYDIDTGRRSPLSAGSSATTFTNHGVSFSAVPTGPVEVDPGVTHIEVWASQDGGLPRFWLRRDIGVTSFSSDPVDTALGESEIGSMDSIPVCKYNTVYHDRLVMAGDELHPERIYFSALGEPEKYEGLWLATRNGERVIGLYVVRDILVVQCQTSHYYIQGFDENDISINVLEPLIGGLGHHTITVLDRMAIFPNKNGWYACNGTSITPIGQKFNKTWSDERHWVMYSGSSGREPWVSVDTVNRIIRYKAPLGSKISPHRGLQTVNGSSIYWCVDFNGIVDEDGGIELFFDTAAGSSTTEPTCGASLTNDDGSIDLYTGHADGTIAIENQHGLNDLQHALDYVWQTPHVQIAKPGDDADCASLVKLWLYVVNEDVPLEWTLYAGNTYDWQAEPISGETGGRAKTGDKAAGAEDLGLARKVYRDRVFLNAENTAGSAISVLVKKPASNPMWANGTIHPAYQGAPLMADGSVFPVPMVVIKGWGMTFKQFGEAARSARSYYVAP